ncbi:MAG: methyltransferase domain-containing protein [Bacteroidales bacterium]|nr:methyltransferase domain-containing protein [Bacteroidales bacterium]
MDEYKLFARIYDPVLYGVLHKIRKKVVELAQSYNPSTIIDICCGTGNQLKYLKKSGFHNVTGIDISQSMLQQVEKGGEPIKCDKQDATELAFRDNHFDMGIISFALHEKPADIARKIVDEARRVIQPGGYLIVVDYTFENDAKPYVKFAVRIVERLAGKEHHRHFKNYIQNGGMDEFLKGFRPIKEYRFHGGATGVRVYQENQYGNYA